MEYTNQKNASEKMREVRGYAIISKGDTPKKIGKDTFIIPSQNGNGEYTVTMKGKPTCTCPDFEKRQKECKHIHAVKFYLDFNRKVKTENKGIVSEKQSCPYCKSVNTVGCGKSTPKADKSKDTNVMIVTENSYKIRILKGIKAIPKQHL